MPFLFPQILLDAGHPGCTPLYDNGMTTFNQLQSFCLKVIHNKIIFVRNLQLCLAIGDMLKSNL